MTCTGRFAGRLHNMSLEMKVGQVGLFRDATMNDELGHPLQHGNESLCACVNNARFSQDIELLLRFRQRFL